MPSLLQSIYNVSSHIRIKIMDIISIISLVRRQTNKQTSKMRSIQHLRAIRKQVRIRESNKERGIPDSMGIHGRIWGWGGEVTLKVSSNQSGE